MSQQVLTTFLTVGRRRCPELREAVSISAAGSGFPASRPGGQCRTTAGSGSQAGREKLFLVGGWGSAFLPRGSSLGSQAHRAVSGGLAFSWWFLKCLLSFLLQGLYMTDRALSEKVLAFFVGPDF